MPTNPLALIVDDEPDIRELIELTLKRMGIDTHSAADVTSAKSLLDKQHFDLCLTDMRLPDGNGIDLIRHIQQHSPDTPTAMITAHGNMQAAVEALKAGAFDFVSKPVELKVLRDLVNSALKLSDQTSKPDRRSRHTLLGESPQIQTIRGTITKLARSQAPVYISGESGTGKELVARLVHEKGPRVDNNFVPVNCGAIPGELMESELFGHKKGSFTGANADKQGLFQAADGGTLFLDEVADLPLSMQVKLLRAIQEKAVRPVGAQQESKVDVRILSATHKDLGQLVKEGRFREDLYYRINVIQLPIASLKERIEDIPELAEHILQRLTKQMDIPAAHLAPEAIEALQRYPFPGNVRELENILERALTLCEGEIININDLQLPAGVEQSLTEATEQAIPTALEPYLEKLEKEALQKALKQTEHNKTAAAKLLGISFRALRYRLKKLGLD